ncbi:hypothetical protein, partial [Streptomyces sp. NPDC001274]
MSVAMRQPRRGWLVLTVVTVGAAVAVAVRAGTGDVDPGGLVLGAAGLVLTAVSLYQAGVAQAGTDTDAAALAERLAVVIRKHEEEVHTGLLGSSTDTIDLEFGFLPSP